MPLLFGLGALAAALSLALLSGRTSSFSVPGVSATGGSASYPELPLSFVPNRGQADPQVRYLAQSGGASFQFSRDRIAISLTKGEQGHALHLRFLGANPSPAIAAGEPQRGKVNHISGRERHTDIPTFATLTYRNLWPGIDMLVRGRAGALKYEFHLAPGADPSDIRLAYAGANGLSLTEGGALNIGTSLGALIDRRPQSFQGRSPIESRYVLHDERSYGFAIGAHRSSRPLVIDPALAYSTYLGGRTGPEGGQETNSAIAVDGSGNAYVAGTTGASDFPVTPGAFDTTFEGGGFQNTDAFVTKLSSDGSQLVYSTFLGGNSDERGNAIAIDSQGSAYVTGLTTSTNFPTTDGAFDRTKSGSFDDTYVTKLSPDGSALEYSTYLGGAVSGEQGFDIAVDAQGSAYFAGRSASSDYPTTPGAFDTGLNGSSDVAVTKLRPDGTGLVYSTLLGGLGFDEAHGIALDEVGNAYLTGTTGSANFPTTPGAHDPSYNGGQFTTFVTKLNATGSALLYSTYLGGSEADSGRGIAIDDMGSAYVTGFTSSDDFPATEPDCLCGVYVTKLNSAGSAIAYSRRLPGSGEAIAVDRAGRAYASGNTGSPAFPTTPDAFDSTHNGNDDAFVTQLSATGSSLLYSTYLGGAGLEGVADAALDVDGSLYLTGVTTSADFPTTPGAYDSTLEDFRDAFVSKLSFGAGPPATLDLAPATATNPLGTEHCVTATSTDSSGDPTPDITVRFFVTGSVETSGSQTTDANGQASFCYQGPSLPGEDQIVAFADTDEDQNPDSGEPSAGATKTWVAPQSTPDCSTSDRGRITTESGSRAFFKGRSDTSPTGQPSGFETYNDRGQVRIEVRSSSIDALVCSDRDATIHGRADVNGDEAGFRIELHDGGSHRRDSYRILLSTGYDSGTQTLRSGNVKVR